MRVVFAEIVAVIGGDQRHAKVFFQLEEVRLDRCAPLAGPDPGSREEVAVAENIVDKVAAALRAASYLPSVKLFGDLAFKAAGEADQALRSARRETSCLRVACNRSHAARLRR